MEFPGFGISGYRSLYGDVQWIDLAGQTTILLGQNNAGKSNVLRLVHQHMLPIYRAVTDRRPLDTFDPRLDLPRTGWSGLSVSWPLDTDSLQSDLERRSVTKDAREALLISRTLNAFPALALPISADALDGEFEINDAQALAILNNEPRVPWSDLSVSLTGQRGGSNGSDTRRVLDHLRQFAVPPPQIVSVPATRSINSASELDEWDFGGRGAIEQIHRILNPRFDEDHLRAQALAIQTDLRLLMSDSELTFSVAHDLSTVNVRLAGRFYPLELLGTGTEHAVLILAAAHVFPDRLLCLEEPDAHMHPVLQRRLMGLFRKRSTARIVVATHSPHLIDAEVDTILAIGMTECRTSVAPTGSQGLFATLQALGYRASDLLQANAIIWVEGPSDRLYVKHWIGALAPDLREGIDFSIVFYGGALRDRLSAKPEGPAEPTLVDLWRVNQNMWLLMDSDSDDPEVLKPGAARLKEEIARSDRGGVWVTGGYTIENYIPSDLLTEAAQQVHPTVTALVNHSRDVDPLRHLVTDRGNTLTRVDKVAIALAVIERPARLDVLDLQERVTEVVTFLRTACSNS